MFPKSERMKTKVQHDKTKRPKNGNGREHTARLAAICQCTPRMVRYSLSGERGKYSRLALKIRVANVLMKQRDGMAACAIRENLFSKSA